MVASVSKCRVCREPAIIDLPRHNANFCAEHLLQLCRRQVEKAIADHDMLDRDDRILVAVSGGKDSLAIWDILLELGYRADGLYIGLGIGDYSDESGGYAQRFADERGLTLRTIDLRGEYGYDVPTAAKVTKRVPCSACGMSKRHLFDEAAREGGYDVVVTGHNLDDEAAVLFGNALRWDVEYLARQLPVLPARDGFPKKVKPLVRLTEREMAAWCIVRGIDYQVEECPMAVGNKHLGYKEALNSIERQSPGSKSAFYLNFIERMAPILASHSRAAAGELVACSSCGAPTTEPDSGDAPVCGFCRLRGRVAGHEPVPVELVLHGSARTAYRAARLAAGSAASPGATADGRTAQ
jgi:tRNA-5-methyluridine54 2-sulfurtransferase